MTDPRAPKYLRDMPAKADVYDVLEAFEVTSHRIGHAIKKLLCAGQRGHKDLLQDLQEAIQSIQCEIHSHKQNEEEQP